MTVTPTFFLDNASSYLKHNTMTKDDNSVPLGRGATEEDHAKSPSLHQSNQVAKQEDENKATPRTSNTMKASSYIHPAYEVYMEWRAIEIQKIKKHVDDVMEHNRRWVDRLCKKRQKEYEQTNQRIAARIGVSVAAVTKVRDRQREAAAVRAFNAQMSEIRRKCGLLDSHDNKKQQTRPRRVSHKQHMQNLYQCIQNNPLYNLK